MIRRQPLIPLLILLVATIVRLIFLDAKPPHFDEELMVGGAIRWRRKDFTGTIQPITMVLSISTCSGFF